MVKIKFYTRRVGGAFEEHTGYGFKATAKSGRTYRFAVWKSDGCWVISELSAGLLVLTSDTRKKAMENFNNLNGIEKVDKAFYVMNNIMDKWYENKVEEMTAYVKYQHRKDADFPNQNPDNRVIGFNDYYRELLTA